VQSSYHDPYSNESEDTEEKIDYFLIDWRVRILHPVHYDVVSPKGRECVEVIGRPAKVKSTTVPMDFGIKPEGSRVLID
jgi:hypothetical protein